MRYFLRIMILLAWGIWFGGLVGMFLFITGLFDSLNAAGLRPIFDQVAPHQFMVSQRLELVAGIFALVMTFGLRLVDRRGAVAWLFGVLALAAILAIVKGLVITPRMLPLIVPGAEPSAEFKKLHGLSMLASLVETGLLLIGGAALPAVFNFAGERESAAPSSV